MKILEGINSISNFEISVNSKDALISIRVDGCKTGITNNKLINFKIKSLRKKRILTSESINMKVLLDRNNLYQC